MSGIGAKSQTGEEHVWRPNPLTHRLELPSIHLSQSRPRTRSHNKRRKRLRQGSALSRCQTDGQTWHTHTHAQTHITHGDWRTDRCISWHAEQYGHTRAKLTHPDANLKISHTLVAVVLDISVAHSLFSRWDCLHPEHSTLLLQPHLSIWLGRQEAHKLSSLQRGYSLFLANPFFLLLLFDNTACWRKHPALGIGGGAKRLSGQLQARLQMCSIISHLRLPKQNAESSPLGMANTQQEKS